jgi:carboxymethylenebutenolidase
MPLADLSRRNVIRGLAATVPLSAVLADPSLARAAAETLESVSLTTLGGRDVRAALALPSQAPAPALMLIHEFWGLNDQIKAVAAEFAREGYLALAVDLYQGKVSSNREEARATMNAVDPAAATDTLFSWLDWLETHAKSTGKLGTVGWCFGGGWSLDASIARPVDATVVYYGRVNRQADQLRSLKGPVLGHFATQDQFINQEMVGRFEAEMREAGKPLTVYWYDANHAFANPTEARYDAADAQLAWKRTLDFLRANLRA